MFAICQFASKKHLCVLWRGVLRGRECDFIVRISQNVEKGIDVEKIVANINKTNKNKYCNKHTKHAHKLNLIGQRKKNKQRKIVEKLLICAVCGTLNLNYIRVAFNIFHGKNKPKNTEQCECDQKCKRQ